MYIPVTETIIMTITIIIIIIIMRNNSNSNSKGESIIRWILYGENQIRSKSIL